MLNLRGQDIANDFFGVCKSLLPVLKNREHTRFLQLSHPVLLRLERYVRM
jgi:hypothetical protein